MKGTLAVRPKAATGAPPADELAVSAADTTGQGAPPAPVVGVPAAPGGPTILRLGTSGSTTKASFTRGSAR